MKWIKKISCAIKELKIDPKNRAIYNHRERCRDRLTKRDFEEICCRGLGSSIASCYRVCSAKLCCMVNTKRIRLMAAMGRIVSLLLLAVLVCMVFVNLMASRFGMEGNDSALNTTMAISSLILWLLMVASKYIIIIVVLMIPQLCSASGRMLLLLYMVSILNRYPMENIKDNANILTNTYVCNQKLLKLKTDLAKERALVPVKSLHKKLLQFKKNIAEYKTVINKTINVLDQHFIPIRNTIYSVNRFFEETVGSCNNRMPSPVSSCLAWSSSVYHKCRRKLWWPVYYACYALKALKIVCLVFKGVTHVFCYIGNIISDIIKEIVSNFNDITTVLRNLFEVSLDMEHHYDLQSESNWNISTVAEHMNVQLKSRFGYLSSIISIVDFIVILTMFWIIISSVIYMCRFIKNELFDNYYITNDLKTVDNKRMAKGVQSIFPMYLWENNVFIKAGSPLLRSKELANMCVGIITVTISALYVNFYLALDYVLFFQMTLLAKLCRLINRDQPGDRVTVEVDQSRDYFSSVYGSFINSFTNDTEERQEYMEQSNSLGEEIEKCMYPPKQPNWEIHSLLCQIYFIILPNYEV